MAAMNDQLNNSNRFHGWSVRIIHPIRGGLVGGREADGMGGGEGEDESQTGSKLKRLDSYQAEHAVDLSPPSDLHFLSDFDLCFSKMHNQLDKKKRKKDLGLAYVQTVEPSTSDYI